MSDISQELTFVTAGLDTDADMAYIKNGDAPWRLNILIGEDGANGVITNNKGNVQGATSYPLSLSEVYKVVGSYYNRLTRKCYYFVFSLPYDSDLSENYIYDNKLLCYNEDDETIDCIFTDTGNWFGLDPYHLMKDCKMIGSWLFFNPQVSEPKMIDVDMAFTYEKAQPINVDGTSVGGYYEWSATEIYTYGDRCIYLGGYWLCIIATLAGESPVTTVPKWDRIEDCYQNVTSLYYFDSEFEYAFNVLKMPPVSRPDIAYGSDLDIQSNNVRGRMFRFAYRFKYFDNTYSVYSAYSKISRPWDDERWNGEILEDTSRRNYIIISLQLHSPALVKTVEVVFQEIGQDWKRCKIINRVENGILPENNYILHFYNNEVYETEDNTELAKVYDGVPRTAGTQELINENILAYGRCKEGFNNIDKDEIDVTLTPRIEPIIRLSVFSELKTDNVIPWGQITYEPGARNSYITKIAVASWFAGAGVAEDDIYELVVEGNHSFKVLTLDETLSPNALTNAMLSTITQTRRTLMASNYNNGTELRISSTIRYPNVTVSRIYTPLASYVDYTEKVTGHKTGANHPYCIFYYDDTLRRWDGQTSKENLHGAVWTMYGTTVYVPMFNEVSCPEIDTGNRWVIDWEVDHLPPDGAKYWRWGYAGNSLCSEFIQYIVSSITNAGSTTLTAIDITPLQELKDPTTGTWNEYPQSNIDQYQWAKGDRIRFITEETDPGIPGTTLGNVVDGLLDYEIIKQSTDLNTIYIQQIVIGDLGKNTLIEIYRPRKDMADTHVLFYEFGDLMSIIEDSTGELVHGGIDQDQDTALNLPATGTFDEGDVYHIMRTPSKPLDDANVTVGAFHESMWWSDFYESDDWDKGKSGEETNFNERTLNIVRYSNVYLQNTGINGLSTFDTNTTEPYGYKELNDVYGNIIAIMEIGDTLKVYQQTKPSSILIGRSEYVDTSGTGDIIKGGKTILGSIRYSPTNYGTEFPESLCRNNRYVYGWDIYNGIVWRDSANGIFPISGRYESVEGSSDYRMATWFKEKAKALLLSGVDNIDVMSTFDEEYKLFILSFRDSVNEDNNATIAFHEPSNRWISFYDFEQVDHDGYNVFLELTYEVLQGFDAGIGFYFNADDRFAYFEIEATGAVSVYPTMITLDMGLQTPSITASGSGSGDQQKLTFTLNTPSIVISYLSASDTDMSWDADKSGSGVAEPTILTVSPSCTITSMPSWITIADILGTTYSVSSQPFYNGQTFYIYPTNDNLGVAKVGTITMATAYGDTETIVVAQDAATISGSFTVSLLPGEYDKSGMTLSDESGYIQSGTVNAYLTFTPSHPDYSAGQIFRIYWTATKNGNFAGNGSFMAHDEYATEDMSIVLSEVATTYDTIIVYLST